MLSHFLVVVVEVVVTVVARCWEWDVLVVCPVVPSHQRGEADDEAQDPGPQDEELGPLGGHDVGVGDGVGHCDVPVEADDHQVEDRGRAHPHVHGQPDGAPNLQYTSGVLL